MSTGQSTAVQTVSMMHRIGESCGGLLSDTSASSCLRSACDTVRAILCMLNTFVLSCCSAQCNLELGRAYLHQPSGAAGSGSLAGQTTSVDSKQLFQLALADCVRASELLQEQGDDQGSLTVDLEFQALQANVNAALEALTPAHASDGLIGSSHDLENDWEELSPAGGDAAGVGVVPITKPLQSSGARVRVCELYENERRPFTRFSWAKDASAIASGGFHHSSLLPTERKRWSTADGNPLVSSSGEAVSVSVSVRPDGVEVIDDTKPPPDGLSWVEKQWRVCVEPGRTDSQGWEYAFNWGRPFDAHVVTDGVSADFVRRRRWQRRASKAL